MITVEKLNNFGANTAEGLARCFGNEALYLKLVATIPGEASFGKLKDALAEKNLKAAFEAAHALKGVLANLSLTPIYTPVAEITELLRSNTDMDYKSLLDTILEKRDELGRLCAD